MHRDFLTSPTQQFSARNFSGTRTCRHYHLVWFGRELPPILEYFLLPFKCILTTHIAKQTARMSRIEELPDDFDEKTDLNKLTLQNDSPQASSKDSPDLIDQILNAPSPFPPKAGQQNGDNNVKSDAPTAAMPPAMHSIRQYSADEVVKMLNRTPLFMTELDETDGEGGENVELEALKALAYEGTRAEVAQNFREQGNDHAKAKNWREAKGYYDQALAALKNPNVKPQDPEEGEPDMDVVEIDAEAEKKKELEIEEACYINRALCNLELSMLIECYGYCIHQADAG